MIDNITRNAVRLLILGALMAAVVLLELAFNW